MKAGSAEIDITPPVATHQIGWIIDIAMEEIADPLLARVAMIESGESAVAFIQPDTVCAGWT